MKKVLSLVLALALILPVAFCGSVSAEAATPIPLEFMAWWPVQMNENDQVVKYFEEKFNVDFTFSLSDWQPNIDNIAMRVASGDYPNVMLVPYYWVPALGEQYTAMIEDNLLVNVSKAAAEGGFANIVNELGRADVYNMKKVYGDANGDYFCLPRDDGLSNPGIFVRQDWLDKAGLKQPATLEEMKEVLRQLVAADFDGTGSVEGLTFAGAGWLEHFLVGYTGVNTSGWYTDDKGEWSYKIYHPGFKEGLKFLHSLYEEKLIDPEFLTAKVSNNRDKFLSGRAAMIMQNANSVDYIDFLQVPAKAYKADAEVSCLVPWPKGPSGARNGSNPYGSMAVIFKTGDEAVDKKVLEIFDYMLSPEGTKILVDGIEGIHYTMDGDTKVVNEEVRKADFAGIEHHLLRHFAYPGVVKESLLPMLKANYEDIKATGVAPQIVGLNTETTSVLEPNLQSVYDTWIVAFVTGEKDIDADYAAFLAEYEATGYPQMLDEVKAFAAK